MMIPEEAAIAGLPTSLLDGVADVAARRLGVRNVGHRSALLGLKSFDGPSLVSAMHDAVRQNYSASGASANKDRSTKNWRWHSPQPHIGKRNRSPEIIIERAVAAACVALGRTDWANQIPVASGLVDGARDGRRAIDLVQRLGARHFRFIELKVASDTPLYAAVELLGYTCLWLIARDDRPSKPSDLLDADRVDLRVLAPASFYTRYALQTAESAFDKGVLLLGERHGVALSFRFDVLDENIRAEAMPEPQALLNLIDRPAALHVG